MANPEIIKALAVTARLMGTALDEDAARIFAEDLSAYPAQQILGALKRCRREVKGRLTVADVVTRIDDGRPGAEEAWSMIPRDEYSSVVWTQEMSQAFGVAVKLLESGDEVAARMAFKETYMKAVQRARDEAEPVKWSPSYGFDKGGRAGAIREAVERGRITNERAVKMLEQSAPEYAEQQRALGGPSRVSDLLPDFSGDAA